MTTFSLYTPFFIARKREVFALRAEFSSLSFPKEKGTKKKENLRAYALKNPPIVQICYAQSRTACLSSPQLRVALRRPLGRKNCTKQKRTNRICNDITSSAHEPSPRGEGEPRQRWMRCAHAEGVGVCVTANYSVDIAHCHPPQTGGVVPFGRSFLPFRFRKKKKPKGKRI